MSTNKKREAEASLVLTLELSAPIIFDNMGPIIDWRI
jgi:hypothetical protein